MRKEDHRFFLLDDSLKQFEVSVHRPLLEDDRHLPNVCKRFIEACDAFGTNTSSVKLATAFVALRLLRIHEEESWNESSIGLLYSPLSERNVGKSLTMDILAKSQGVRTRRHPTMLAELKAEFWSSNTKRGHFLLMMRGNCRMVLKL